MIPKISLEQWATFKAVVDEGSFAKAADRLNKSQSSVSYIIGRMEDQLPMPALQIQGRKAVLTESGKVLYRHATNLLLQAVEVEDIAHCLARGWETEITLAVDTLVPNEPLFCALQAFSQQSPTTRIRLLETTLSGTDETLLFRQAGMVLTPTVLPGFMGIPLSMAQMRYVVSPAHPLAQLNRPLYESDLKQYRQIVIRDSGTKRQQDSGWLGAEQRWTVSHIATSVAAVVAGLGFANLPLERIQPQLTAHQLVVLEFASGVERNLPLYLVKSAQTESGPATEALTKLIVSAFASKTD